MRRALRVVAVGLVLTGCATGSHAGASAASARVAAGHQPTERQSSPAVRPAGPGWPGPPAATTAATAAAASSASGARVRAATQPGPATPPGRYLYTRTGSVNGCDGTSQPDNGTTVLTITAPAAGQRQEVQDERDSHGQGQVTTTVYSFSGISVRLVRLVVDDYYPGGRLSFDFAGSPPPAVLSQHPLAGQTWSYRLRSTDGSATLSGTDTVQTTGTRQQLSGRSSQSIQVDVVDVRATLTTSFAGTPVQFRIDSLMSLRITDLLPVRMRTTSDGSVGTCRIHTTEDDLLQAA